MTTKLATDADFDNDILRGLLRRNPALDIVRVQDVGLRTADDPTILEWAAFEGRVIIDARCEHDDRARGSSDLLVKRQMGC